MNDREHDVERQIAGYLIASTIGTTLSALGWLSPATDTVVKLVMISTLLYLTLRSRWRIPALSVLTPVGLVLIAAILIFRGVSQSVHLSDARLVRQSLEILAVVFVLGDPAEWRGVSRGFFRYAKFYVVASGLALLISPLAFWEVIWAKERFSGLFGNAVNHAINLALMLPFVLELARTRREKLFYVGSIVLFLVLSRSRTATFVATLVILLYWFKPWVKPFALSVRQAGILAAFGVCALLFRDSLVSFLARDQSATQLASFTGRTQLWDVALATVAKDPLFGVGSSAQTLGIWSRLARRYWTTTGGAHNHYLATSAQMGIPLAAAYLTAVLGAVGISTFRLFKFVPRGDVLVRRRLFACSAIGMLIFSMFESNLEYVYFPIGWIFWWNLLGAFTQETEVAR